MHERQTVALVQVVQLLVQGLHSPVYPYWPLGQVVTHIVLERYVLVTQEVQVSVVLVQVLQGERQP